MLINTVMPNYVDLIILHTLLSLLMLQEGYRFMEFALFMLLGC